MGLVEDAAVFIDITYSVNPFEVGRICGTPSYPHLKYWNRHVYICTEDQEGVTVISLNDPDNPVSYILLPIYILLQLPIPFLLPKLCNFNSLQKGLDII